MKWSDIPFNPTPKTLRQFAGAWLAFFFGAAALQGLVRGHWQVGLGLGILAGAVGGLGLIRPLAIRWIFVGMTVLAFPIGWMGTQVVLAILYFGVFTPVAVIFRLGGRDLLGLKPKSGKSTYWTAKHTPQDVTSYFHQF